MPNPPIAHFVIYILFVFPHHCTFIISIELPMKTLKFKITHVINDSLTQPKKQNTVWSELYYLPLYRQWILLDFICKSKECYGSMPWLCKNEVLATIYDHSQLHYCQNIFQILWFNERWWKQGCKRIVLNTRMWGCITFNIYV